MTKFDECNCECNQKWKLSQHKVDLGKVLYQTTNSAYGRRPTSACLDQQKTHGVSMKGILNNGGKTFKKVNFNKLDF